MPTCYIFTKYLREDGCLMLRLNDAGLVDMPPEHQTFETIQKIQDNCKTILVMPCENASIFDLELPWLTDKKARMAIPFALEDKLSQSQDELHFAFDKQHYRDGHYEIVVMDKAILQSLMDTFNEKNVHFDSITLDWYALHPNEIFFTEDAMLVYTDQFKGALSSELTSAFKTIFNGCQAYAFKDSKPALHLEHVQNIDELANSFIAKRLADNLPLNLCQGDLQHGTSAEEIKRGYQLAGLIGIVALLFIIGSNGIKLYLLNHKIDTINREIATIYREFFPDAKQVINPKFRISQLLGNQNQSQFVFWNLLHKLAKGIKEVPAQIEQFRFNGTSLSVTVVASDFAQLEQLENALKKMQLNVTQTQASNRDQLVVATLELE